MTGTYRPATAILALGDEFYDPATPADFPQTILRYHDEDAAGALGLKLDDDDWVRHFGRFEALPDNLSEPLALRYHGHQFRQYNPEIGDGRGFLFAQLRDGGGRLLDLGTKGSGTTPYSRRGDGRLTLLGGVREVLATRYLEHLGVNTSKSFCLIETGEELTRGDEPSPTRSAVLTRLSHSHIRFGAFQRQAYFQNRDNLAALSDYCRTHFYPDTESVEGMFAQVVARSADSVASWMAAGFVHGVMNTDNMNITGETFDYGPYRFLPHFDPNFTAAYFDHQGLYAFGRQPEAMAWNLAQLAQSLSLIAEDQALIDAMDSFAPLYQAALNTHFLRRLQVESRGFDEDVTLVRAIFKFLLESQTPWPDAWHDWQGGAGRADTPQLHDYRGAAYDDWLELLKHHTPTGEKPDTERPASLLYDEIGALWEPIAADDDWSAFENKLKSFDRA
ncbi:protein adenylyltransferase SelO family protein [Litorimonas sp. RW-G-Af-16]|uniref:protein adenylyltransferase SelO family protein n=1 Tax=Litorimonas sp. RW-G-Af-16 TaxID=3241168 RepID=UPI00390C5322